MNTTENLAFYRGHLKSVGHYWSYVFAYTALSMERVSLMSPLINGSSLFILPLSALFLKDVEKITARIIAAILLVLFGVFLISWEKL